MTAPSPIRRQPRQALTVTVTGAAGQIAYALLFRLASGEVFGHDVPVRLRLLDIPQAMAAVDGVVMELHDTASKVLESIDVFDVAGPAFDGTEHAFLVGARPRTAGMERSDLLAANAPIFVSQGKALNEGAAAQVRVSVVGNPANTNALITASHAPDIPPERFTAITRLDHNRAVFQLARRARVAARDVKRLTIWGNHSATQYPDIRYATVAGQPAVADDRDTRWLLDSFVPTVAGRGAAVLQTRGGSSVASAATAVIDHQQDWIAGTPQGDWTSVALISHGEYGVPAGLISSFPVTSDGSAWQIVPDLVLDELTAERIEVSVAELESERAAVAALGLLGPARLG